MSTSIGDLLALTGAELRDLHGDVHDAHIAIAVAAPAARALTRVAEAEDIKNRNGTLSPHGQHAAKLAQACRQAANAWPSVESRPASLTGAAADLTSQVASTLGPAQRWALTVAFAETARSAAAAARRFGPYRAIPELVAVHHTSALVEQQATIERPSPAGRTVLEHLVAAPDALGLTGMAAAAEAAVGLGTAIHASAARQSLTLLDLLATAAAAETSSRYGTALVRTVRPQGPPQMPWASNAPEAWHAVTLACAPFDDGTKGRPAPSQVLSLARMLDARLRGSLGPADNAVSDRLRNRGDLAEVATHLRTIANQLPDVATQLRRGAVNWIEQQRLLAPERFLPSYEQRGFSARTATNHIVVVGPGDFKALLSALDDTSRLAAALSGELHTAAHLGRQLQPNLAAARAAGTADPTEQTLLQRSANRAALRAGATGVTHWAFPRPPQRHGPAR